MSDRSTLIPYGWDDAWAEAFAEHAGAGLVPARVAVQHRGAYDLVTADGDVRAPAAARMARADELPAVGDWVAFDPEGALVQAVLPRRTVLSRKEVFNVVREQILAANVDVAFLAQALPLDFNPRRLERYLAMVWESGARPVILLTKADLAPELDPFLAEAEAVTLGACPLHAISARTGNGLDVLGRYLTGHRTAVVLGSSGAGKSTLVNALLGEERQATQDVREDDQEGRHTTTRRELIVLPHGGVILDTPGMRELHLWDADLEQTFGDVEEIARRCRFSDCSHVSEPGCAIQEALADGSLSRERWESYGKLQRELTELEARRDPLLRQARTRVWKQRTKEYRRSPNKKQR